MAPKEGCKHKMNTQALNKEALISLATLLRACHETGETKPYLCYDNLSNKLSAMELFNTTLKTFHYLFDESSYPPGKFTYLNIINRIAEVCEITQIT